MSVEVFVFDRFCYDLRYDFFNISQLRDSSYSFVMKLSSSTDSGSGIEPLNSSVAVPCSGARGEVCINCYYITSHCTVATVTMIASLHQDVFCDSSNVFS